MHLPGRCRETPPPGSPAAAARCTPARRACAALQARESAAARLRPKTRRNAAAARRAAAAAARGVARAERRKGPRRAAGRRRRRIRQRSGSVGACGAAAARLWRVAATAPAQPARSWPQIRAVERVSCAGGAFAYCRYGLRRATPASCPAARRRCRACRAAASPCWARAHPGAGRAGAARPLHGAIARVPPNCRVRRSATAPRAKRHASGSGNAAPPSPLPAAPKEPVLGSSSETSAAAGGEDEVLDEHFAHALLGGCVPAAARRGSRGGARRPRLRYAAGAAQRLWVCASFSPSLTRGRCAQRRRVRPRRAAARAAVRRGRPGRRLWVRGQGACAQRRAQLAGGLSRRPPGPAMRAAAALTPRLRARGGRATPPCSATSPRRRRAATRCGPRLYAIGTAAPTAANRSTRPRAARRPVRRLRRARLPAADICDPSARRARRPGPRGSAPPAFGCCAPAR